MIRKLSKSVVSIVIIVATVFSLGMMSFAKGESHNVYTSPDVSNTSGGFDAFMIDFKTDSENALATYWALANYTLDNKASIKQLGYINLENPRGYAGLQDRYSDTDRVGIMSVWEYSYLDAKNGMKKVTLNAERMFPSGSDSFDNEGSGVKCIYDYPWKDHQWYRMLLLCWEDAELGRTFAGTWFYDYEANEWTLFCYYNYQLVDSYFISGFSQFQENFQSSKANIYRSFNYKNFYVLDHDTKKWVSTPKISLSSCTYPDKVGIVGGGISEDKTEITGFADGSKRDQDYVKLDKSYTLKQDALPSFGKPAVKDFTVTESGNSTVFNWTAQSGSTPQLSYNLKVVDSEGNEILSKYETRPEINQLKTDKLPDTGYKCILTVKDVFGQETTSTFASENYRENDTQLPNDTESPESEEPTQTPQTVLPATPDTITPDDTTNENEQSGIVGTVVIIIIACATVIVLIAAAVIIKKKK